MANIWKWWIVITCEEDWYTILRHAKVVKARSAGEAEGIALEGEHSHIFAAHTFGPFDEEPKEA